MLSGSISHYQGFIFKLTNRERDGNVKNSTYSVLKKKKSLIIANRLSESTQIHRTFNHFLHTVQRLNIKARKIR